MRRLIPLVAVLGTIVAEPDSRAQIKPGDLKDYNDAMQALKSSSAPDRAAGLSFLALLGAEAKGSSREVIGALFDANPDARKWAGMALEKVNPTLAGPVLTLVRSQNDQDRAAALTQLSKLGDTAAPAIPALLTLLQQQAQGVDRVSLVQTLTLVGSKDAKLSGVLATMALNDPDAKVRSAAVQGILKQQDTKAASEVFQRQLQDTDPAKRAAAVTSMGDIAKGNAQMMAVLKKSLEDPSPTVRNAAKLALDKIAKDTKKK